MRTLGILGTGGIAYSETMLPSMSEDRELGYGEATGEVSV